MTRLKSTKENSMDTLQTVSNLEKMGQVLSTAANKPENYNTDWAYYLEQMSFSLFRQADDLRDLMYLFEGPSSNDRKKLQ